MSFAVLLEPAAKAHDLPASEAFADLRAHVARLDLPDGEAVDWRYVQQLTTSLLVDEGKDLLVATYAAFAPLALESAPSPHSAITFLQQFIERFWQTMTPPVARSRARANSISWFVTRMRVLLPTLITRLSDVDKQLAHKAWVDLSATLAERLGPQAPSTSAVLRLLEAPAPNEAVPKAPPDNAASVAPPATPVLTAPATSPASQQPEDCRSLARSLCLLAKQIRQIDPTDVQACRLWRVGLWLNVATAPALLGKVTRVVAVPEQTRARLTEAQRTRQWAHLYHLAEETMFAHPLCLDLQYFAAEAARNMGDAHLPLAALIRSETQALCQRIPALLELSASDGTPLAMHETQIWLALHPSSSPARASIPQAGRAASSRARRRFCRQLQRAQTALAQGQIDTAEAIYDGLVRQARRRGLMTWEPQLARQVAEGHFDALLRQVPPELSRVRRAWRRWNAFDAEAAQHQAARITALQDVAR